jgi:hypothetical protein
MCIERDPCPNCGDICEITSDTIDNFEYCGVDIINKLKGGDVIKIKCEGTSGNSCNGHFEIKEGSKIFDSSSKFRFDHSNYFFRFGALEESRIINVKGGKFKINDLKYTDEITFNLDMTGGSGDQFVYKKGSDKIEYKFSSGANGKIDIGGGSVQINQEGKLVFFTGPLSSLGVESLGAEVYTINLDAGDKFFNAKQGEVYIPEANYLGKYHTSVVTTNVPEGGMFKFSSTADPFHFYAVGEGNSLRLQYPLVYPPKVFDSYMYLSGGDYIGFKIIRNDLIYFEGMLYLMSAFDLTGAGFYLKASQEVKTANCEAITELGAPTMFPCLESPITIVYNINGKFRVLSSSCEFELEGNCFDVNMGMINTETEECACKDALDEVLGPRLAASDFKCERDCETGIMACTWTAGNVHHYGMRHVEDPTKINLYPEGTDKACPCGGAEYAFIEPDATSFECPEPSDTNKKYECKLVSCQDDSNSCFAGSIAIIPACGEEEAKTVNIECNEGDLIQCFPSPENYFYTYHRGCAKTGEFKNECVPDYNLDIKPLTPKPSCENGQQWTCPRQFGVCQGSTTTCINGQWPDCNYNAITGYNTNEICDDGLDNDCDGSIDEGCLCSTGDTQQCCSLVNSCTAGTQECLNSKWGECDFAGAYYPSPEYLRDDQDDDCDGSMDEGFTSGIIGMPEGVTKECGINIGECKTGTQTYTSKTFIEYGTLWGICIGAKYPTFEPSRIACGDGLDNDCDNSIDEGCYCDTEGEAKNCSGSVGVCAEGVQTCISSQWSECEGGILPEEEYCGDDLDNDCDGTADEGCPCEDDLTEKPCDLQKGVCEGLNQTCKDGQWQECEYDELDDYEEKENSCSDELDNDCDGEIDKNDTNCQASTKTCSDGTLPSQCSTSKPKYCVDGMLKYNCDKCGCPSDMTCKSTGECVTKVICPISCGSDRSCNADCSTTPGCSVDPDCVGAEEPSIDDYDNDGLSDDEEVIMGTDPYDSDTDGDGVIDNIDSLPLCNEDGRCDSGKEYPETKQNCDDCKTKFPLWLLILVIIIILAVGAYYLYKKKEKKRKQEKKPLTLAQLTEKIGAPIQQPKRRANIDQLYDYVKRALGRGLKEPQIRDSALKAGWTKEEIDEAFNRFKPGTLRRTALDNLNDYIKLNLRKGKKEGEVRLALIKAGWKKQDIINAFRKIKAEKRTK